MKKILLITLFFSLLLNAQNSLDKSGIKRSIVVIPVSGEVDPGMAAFIGKSLCRDTTLHDPLFILKMDTFGGRVDAALNIVDTLSTITNGQTIAFVEKRAISAGSLIALACDKLYMKENTTIGDCAPITYSDGKPHMLGEKFQSPLRAKFRALATKNNYPTLLAEAMVSATITVHKLSLQDSIIYVDSIGLSELSKTVLSNIIEKKTVVRRGELLTMNNSEAVSFGFSQESVTSVEHLIEKLGIKDYTIINLEENWSERFARFIGKIAPILMMIGLAALYIEVKSPGFGIPGIIGAILLTIVFAGQYMVGLADHTETILIIIGGMLLVAEVFIIPGFGLAGALGILSLTIGLALSFQDFVIPRPEMPWQKELLIQNSQIMIFVLFGSIVAIILFFKYLFPALPRFINGPNLSTNLSESHITDTSEKNIKVGDTGTVHKTLRPTGKIIINGLVFDALSEDGFLEVGTLINVVSHRGNSWIVERSNA